MLALIIISPPNDGHFVLQGKPASPKANQQVEQNFCTSPAARSPPRCSPGEQGSRESLTSTAVPQQARNRGPAPQSHLLGLVATVKTSYFTPVKMSRDD